MNQDNKQSKSAKRSSNLELYRIITMLLIVAHHYVVCSGLLNVMEQNYTSPISVFYYIFGMWGKTGINCFVMITGYFMCQSKITLRKFLKLYFEVIFYGLVILGIFVVIGKADFSLGQIVFALLPFCNVVSDNFVNAFMVWWLTIPFLNILIRNMTRHQHLLLILFCVVIFSLYDKIPITEIAVNPICWFSTIYFIASYIRFYPESIYKSDSSKVWGLLSIVMVLFTMACVPLIQQFYVMVGKANVPYGLVSDYNAPLALVVAVTTFMFFKNLKIKNSSFINTVGATTFGVLLIHTNGYVRNWLWGTAVGCVNHYDYSCFWLYAPMAVILIFVGCSVIDYIRIRFIERPFLQWVDTKLNAL